MLQAAGQPKKEKSMQRTIIAVALALAAGSAAAGPGSIIETMCGLTANSAATGPGDIAANPAGFYIRSLATQISDGDPRIVRTAGTDYYLCTRAAATPDMSATEVLRRAGGRVVRYLFVPAILPVIRPGA